MVLVVKKACFPKLHLRDCDGAMVYEGQRHVALNATRHGREKDERSWRRCFCWQCSVTERRFVTCH